MYPKQDSTQWTYRIWQGKCRSMTLYSSRVQYSIEKSLNLTACLEKSLNLHKDSVSDKHEVKVVEQYLTILPIKLHETF